MKKLVVLTGGLNGIGHTIASRFAEEGYHVAIIDNDDSQTLGSFDENLQMDISLFHCDVSDANLLEGVFERLSIDFGNLEVLVCNAGILVEGPLLTARIEDYKRILEINTVSVLRLVQLAFPLFKKNGQGRILVASSFASIIPSLNSGLYASSKLALDSLVRVLAVELGGYNVTVNSYAPGMVPSSMSGINDWSEGKRNFMKSSVAKDKFGRPEDIANLLIFLASDAASYITGTKIDISGGKYAVQLDYEKTLIV
jgi:3-oxoacyl-[acyl-carrier protein] reductase